MISKMVIWHNRFSIYLLYIDKSSDIIYSYSFITAYNKYNYFLNMELGTITYLTAVTNIPAGSFLQGTDGKDIFIPQHEQIDEMQIGEEYLVIILFDEKSQKKYASEKIEKHLLGTVSEGVFYEGQEVDIVVYGFSPLGVKVAINKQYKGLIFEGEIFQSLYLADNLKGFIKQIREDGKIDISLTKHGYKNVVPTTAQQILTELTNNGGTLPFNDKTAPDAIYEKFKMSKNVFKQAIGDLYKKRKIRITQEGIEQL